MEKKMIGDKTLDQWIREHPILEKIITESEEFRKFFSDYSILPAEDAILESIHCMKKCRMQPILYGQQEEAWYLRMF